MSEAAPKLLYDTDAEMAVLGTIIRSNKQIAEVVPIISPEDFHEPANTILFATCCELHEESQVVDTVTVINSLKQRDLLEKAGGQKYILDLAGSGYLPSSAGAYAKLVKNASTRRRLLEASDKIRQLAWGTENLSEIIDQAQALIMPIGTTEAEDKLRPLREVASEAFLYIAEISKEGHRPGIMTGIHALDRITGGFQTGDLVIVAARPSVGKTAYAVQIAMHAITKNKVAVLMFSLEMDAKKIYMRMLAFESRVNMHSIMTGNLDDEDIESCKTAGEDTRDLSMWIDESSELSVMSIKAKSRKIRQDILNNTKASLKEQAPLGLIIVDYLQLIVSPSRRTESRAQEVAEISRQLKSLARELEVPVVALSQLNREVEKRPGAKPMLSDIRDSGAIEQDADIVLLLNRPGLTSADDKKKELGEIIIAKHRNGPTGTVDIRFIPDIGQFYENKKDGSKEADNEV